jgi:hypothetical protein
LSANGKKNGKPDNLASVMTDVSERVTVLVKEELELAKAEVQQKISSLSKGLIAGGIGLVLALLFVPFALLTLAWGLNSLLGSLWLGFLIVMGVLLIAMAVCFLIAWRKIKVGPPAPTMAIAEAKKIRETVSAKGNGNGNGAVPAAAVPAPVAIAPVPPPAPAPAPVAVAAPEAPVAVPAPEASVATIEAPTVVVLPAETVEADVPAADAPVADAPAADAPAPQADEPEADASGADAPEAPPADAPKSE